MDICWINSLLDLPTDILYKIFSENNRGSDTSDTTQSEFVVEM